jgi:hypothetical protein
MSEKDEEIVETSSVQETTQTADKTQNDVEQEPEPEPVPDQETEPEPEPEPEQPKLIRKKRKYVRKITPKTKQPKKQKKKVVVEESDDEEDDMFGFGTMIARNGVLIGLAAASWYMREKWRRPVKKENKDKLEPLPVKSIEPKVKAFKNMSGFHNRKKTCNSSGFY